VGGTFANPDPCQTGAQCNPMLAEASGKKCLKVKKTLGVLSRRGRPGTGASSARTHLPNIEEKETIYYKYNSLS
jgi:hypothetical protein